MPIRDRHNLFNPGIPDDPSGKLTAFSESELKKMKAYRLSPVFRVSDLADAIAFYTSKLGFTEEFVYGEPAYYAGVRKDDVLIHLNSADLQDPALGKAYVYIFCQDIDEYYEKLRNSGVVITSEIETWPYGMRDFQIADCSGNHLSFGCSVAFDPNESQN